MSDCCSAMTRPAWRLRLKQISRHCLVVPGSSCAIPFASRYSLVLPSEEELRRELDRERTMLLEQAEEYQADGGDHE